MRQSPEAPPRRFPASTQEGTFMKKLLTLVCAGFIAVSMAGAFAADDMMKKDGMAKKDEMKKDAMKKDEMKKDGMMKKDEMKK
jgi:pentapeptide MXKDX repeat protein